jgi:flagellar basal-body rod modification protein FlgD
MTIAATTAPTTTPSTTGSSANPLASLTANMNDFLKLLMTQLRNQDPTTPMDSTQFTGQLVQFASVEQQVNTNTGIQTLIQLAQSNNVLQTSSLIGKTVTAKSSQISVQSGIGSIQFNTPAAEPVTVTVTNGAGTTIAQASLTSAAGANTWTWDGKDSTGHQWPDGAYAVTVLGGAQGTTPAAIPFTVSGIASGVTTSNNTEQVLIGQLTLPVSAIRSVGN